MSEISALQQRIEDARHTLDISQRKGDLERAAELTYAILPGLQNELDSAKEELSGSDLVDEQVEQRHIAQVISQWTGIPVAKMMREEQDKLLDMETSLGKRVIGQEQAIQVISNAVGRARAGLNDLTSRWAAF